MNTATAYSYGLQLAKDRRPDKKFEIKDIKGNGSDRLQEHLKTVEEELEKRYDERLEIKHALMAYTWKTMLLIAENNEE